MTVDLAIAAKLEELASRARRLPPPSARRPDEFHEARSELGRDIAKLAECLRTGRNPD